MQLPAGAEVATLVRLWALGQVILVPLLGPGCTCSGPLPLVVSDGGECILLFDNLSQVVGMDGTSSIALAGERTLFLFADTFFGRIEDGDRKITGGQDNTAAIVRNAEVGTCFAGTRFVGGSDPARVFAPYDAGGRSFWPNHGRATADGGLTLFFFHPDKAGLDGIESGVARGSSDPPLVDPGAGAFAPSVEGFLGSALLVHEGNAYVYRCNTGKIMDGGSYPCVVGRTSPEALHDPSTYRYFVAGQGYTGTYANASLVTEGGSEFTTSFNPWLGRFLQVSVEPFGTEVIARVAAAPEGPWSAKRPLWRCWTEPNDPTSFCYVGKEHVSLRSADGRQIVVTYNTNGDFFALGKNPLLYWPRMVRIDLAKAFP